MPSRWGFFGALEDGVARGERRPLAVGLISLDGFSAINDAHGHRVGDRILHDLAVRLKRMAPEAFVAHLGGGKFGFFVQADPRQAKVLTEAVRELAAAPYEIADLCLRVGCSGGLAILQGDGDTADVLLERAYCALRSAKASNLGCVTLYDADLERRVRKSRAIEAALQACDPAREMSILFQPIHDLDAGRVTSVEALARWTSPELGPVPPDVFIATAERLGLIHTMRNFEVAADTVRLLRSLGARVALDDFGSGYSSLGYLHRMAFDRVKIDRSFMTQVERSEGRRLLTSVVALCRNLDLGCIMEGVETPEQLAIVRKIGCGAYQGYLLSRPVTPDQFLASIRSPNIDSVVTASNQLT